MIIDLYKDSMLPAKFDAVRGKLFLEDDVNVNEEGVRMFSDMSDLFFDNRGQADIPLYYMYNGIYFTHHKELFEEHRLKYEYTMLLPGTVEDEYIKAHGHIHSAISDPKKGVMEAFEILYGEGCFLLFKEVEQSYEVIIVNVKQEDKFTIPKEYYHLTINTGKVPFIFGDIISTDNKGDYSFLKEKQGAPVFVMQDKCGGVKYKMNPRYSRIMDILICDVNTKPWKETLPNQGPLYAAFILEPEKFEFLSKPY